MFTMRRLILLALCCVRSVTHISLLLCVVAGAARAQVTDVSLPSQSTGVLRVSVDSSDRLWTAINYGSGVTGGVFMAQPGSINLVDAAGGAILDYLGNGMDYRSPGAGTPSANVVKDGSFYPQAGTVNFFGEARSVAGGYRPGLFQISSGSGRYACTNYVVDTGKIALLTAGPFPGYNGKLYMVGQDNPQDSKIATTALYEVDPQGCKLTTQASYGAQIGQVWPMPTGEYVAERYKAVSTTVQKGIGFILSEIVALRSGSLTVEVSADDPSAKIRASRCCEMIVHNPTQTAMVLYAESGLPKAAVRNKNGQYSRGIDLAQTISSATDATVRLLAYNGRYGLVMYDSVSTNQYYGNGLVLIDTETGSAWTVLTTRDFPTRVRTLNIIPFDRREVGLASDGTIFVSMLMADQSSHLYRAQPPLLEPVTVRARETFTLSGKNLDGFTAAATAGIKCTGLTCLAPDTPGTYSLAGEVTKDGWSLHSNPITLTVTEENRPVFSASAVVDSASGKNPCSPGAICSLYGTNLSAGVAANSDSQQLPTALSGTQLFISGNPAPLFFVSPGQINFLMPSELPASSVLMQVRTPAGLSSSISVPIAEAGPGLYQFQSFIIAQDTSYRLVGIPENPIRPGSTIIMYGTGLGATSCGDLAGRPAPLDRLCSLSRPILVRVGAASVEVGFAGLVPGFFGLYQINVRIPEASASETTLQRAVISVQVGGAPASAEAQALVQQ